jgi:hypothetical protein
VLGDNPPAGKASAAADVATLLRAGGPGSIAIGRDGGKKAAPIFARDFLPPAPVHDLVEIARAAEGLSRIEFPRALKRLGLDGQAHGMRADGAVPASVENQLASLGLVEPLAAVRALQAATHDDGESPARLGALMRGYARLGVQSEFLWSPAHKVFKARALLYAQRLVARDPKSPCGLWHRATVEALIGLHMKAQDDIGDAEKLAPAGADPAAPAWVEPLVAYCHIDRARLKHVTGPETNFAALRRPDGAPGRRARACEDAGPASWALDVVTRSRLTEVSDSPELSSSGSASAFPRDRLPILSTSISWPSASVGWHSSDQQRLMNRNARMPRLP